METFLDLFQSRRRIRLTNRMGPYRQAVNHQWDQRCRPQEVVVAAAAVVVVTLVQLWQLELVNWKDRHL
jgi:hypothetical protein